MPLRIMAALVAMILGIAPCTVPAQCNGDPALCGRPYDEVCYATTHNAFNYQGAFLFPNQSHDVARQLQDGVRGLMLDVYWYNGRPTVYHSSNFLGNQPLGDILADVKSFLDGNPGEVVTIIFESYITAAQMADAFMQAGLLPYLHTQPVADPWPTLGDLIATGERLVVFTDVDDGQAYPWYHYVWDYAVETHYSADSRLDFSCDYNRGDSANGLFILNHFVTQSQLGYGLIDSAEAVNANPYLLGRAMGCWAATGKMPNFLTVDFYERGDVMAAKDALNAGFVHRPGPTEGGGAAFAFPNPTQGQVALRGLPTQGPSLVQLRDLHGRSLGQWMLADTGHSVELPADLANGCYLIEVTHRNQTLRQRLLLQR